MVRSDVSSASRHSNPETAQKGDICPTCGKPKYSCKCIERWEDEGGAVRAPKKPSDEGRSGARR